MAESSKDKISKLKIFCVRYNKQDQNNSFYSHAWLTFQLSPPAQEKIKKTALRSSLWPPLDSPQQVHVVLVLRPLELDAVLQVGSHQSKLEVENPLPQPAAFLIASTHCWVMPSFSSTLSLEKRLKNPQSIMQSKTTLLFSRKMATTCGTHLNPYLQRRY